MKRIKMMLYGEPGVGKSVFASKAPKPFFITTDGNYEWLEDFGADPNAHKQVFSWAEAKAVFENNFDGYETIVVDLLEDLFKWCEAEYCTRAKIDHVSDVGYGKGYDISRNEFFMEICKLLGKDKNVILLCHGITFSVKDRRGVEHTKYAPSNRIPDKVMDMIEGRLRYCLRCYLKAEEQADGTVLKKRYLSVVPKENEFGIIRGVDENKIPHDIELDFGEFAKVIGMTEAMSISKTIEVPVKEVIKTEPVKQVIEDTADNCEMTVAEYKAAKEKASTPVVQENAKDDKPPFDIPEPAKEPVKQVVEEPKPIMSNADKIAAIKAKLAAINAQNK